MKARLSPDEVQAATRPIATARGLPNRAYTAPEWAVVEREGLFGPTWACLGFADELTSCRAVPIDFLGLPLVAIRDRVDVIRVFHNVCRHRGHRLVDQPRELKAGFVCPYHCWIYGFDGSLLKTPHIGGTGIHQVEGFHRARHGLFEVRSQVWMGMVFVNLSGDARAFADYVAPLVERWEAFTGVGELERLVSAPPEGVSSLEVQANWKLAVENYLESYHLPFVHPTLNSYSKIEDHYNILAQDWGAGQGSTAFDYAERFGVAFPPFPQWPADKRTFAEYIALFPNVLLGLQFDHAFAMVLKPDSHERTVESVRLLFVGDEALKDDYASARVTLLKDWMSVFDEDVRVVEGMQRGRASPAFDGGAFSPFHDTPTHHFHGWVARRLGGVPAGLEQGQSAVSLETALGGH
jgi:choline monooxygenase